MQLCDFVANLLGQQGNFCFCLVPNLVDQRHVPWLRQEGCTDTHGPSTPSLVLQLLVRQLATPWEQACCTVASPAFPLCGRDPVQFPLPDVRGFLPGGKELFPSFPVCRLQRSPEPDPGLIRLARVQRGAKAPKDPTQRLWTLRTSYTLHTDKSPFGAKTAHTSTLALLPRSQASGNFLQTDQEV